jgi:hypothetical protein
MAMALIYIGTATVAWALMHLITELDTPKKKEPQHCGNNVRARYGR